MRRPFVARDQSRSHGPLRAPLCSVRTAPLLLSESSVAVRFCLRGCTDRGRSATVGSARAHRRVGRSVPVLCARPRLLLSPPLPLPPCPPGPHGRDRAGRLWPTARITLCPHPLPQRRPQAPPHDPRPPSPPVLPSRASPRRRHPRCPPPRPATLALPLLRPRRRCSTCTCRLGTAGRMQRDRRATKR